MSLKLGGKMTMRRRGDGNAAYARIAADIRGSVNDSGLAPGAILPSLRQLAAEYKVSIATIQQAVGVLVADGVLTAKANHGLFVAHPIVQLAEQTKQLGRSEQVFESTAPDFGVRDANRRAVPTSVRQLHIGIVAPIWNESSPAKGNKGMELVRAIEGTLSENGASTEYSNIGAVRPVRPEHVAACTRRLVESRVDAIALAYVEDAPSIKASLQIANASNTPIVLVGSNFPRVPVSRVYYDGRDAGAQAAQHLIKQGCQNLMFFSPFSADWVIDRLAGVRDALEMAGMPASSLTVRILDRDLSAEHLKVDDNIHFVRAEQYATTLFREGLMADGIVADNDESAIGLMKAAQSLGVQAGKDYLIVGFDDHPWARTEGLTTLRPPIEGLGQTAARLLLEASHGRDSNQSICLLSHLVIRNSTRREILLEV